MTRGAVLTLTCALLLSGVARARTTTYAVSVGNNAVPTETSEVLTKLRFADDDAVRMYQLLSQLTDDAVLLASLDSDSQRRYPGLAAIARPPTWEMLNRTLATVAQRVDADLARGDTPIVYLSFSGHGARAADGSFFLALEGGQQLTQQRLYDEVLTPLSSAMVHVLIDACHAEAIVGTKGAFDREHTMARVAVSGSEAANAFEVRLPERFSRVGLITATTADQQAHEWSRIESGVFTYEVLSGLSGAADVNHDGVIEYSELAAFIASANRDFTDPRAIPAVVALAPRSDVHSPLMRFDALRHDGTIEGHFDLGHFFVELENGLRVVDAHLGAAEVARIRVPAGRAYVVAGSREAPVALRANEAIDVGALRFETRGSAARGSVELALTNAFKSPFSREYYQGYVDSRREPSVRFEATSVTTAPSLTARQAGRWLTAGASAVAGVATLVFAIEAGLRFESYQQATFQRPAAEALSSAYLFLGLSIASAAITTGLALWSWQLTDDVHVTVAPTGPGVGARVTF